MSSLHSVSAVRFRKEPTPKRGYGGKMLEETLPVYTPKQADRDPLVALDQSLLRSVQRTVHIFFGVGQRND